MTGLVLALLAAVAYGTADFAGGILSRRGHVVLIVLVGQAASSTMAVGAAVLVGGSPPTGTTLAWSVLAGAGALLGTLALFRGFAIGRMAVAGPLSAVGAAGIPALVDLASGARLSASLLVGLLSALPGIWLVSTTTGHQIRKRGGVREGMVAGVGFAVLFVGLDHAGSSAGLWPVAISQATSLAALSAVVLVRRPVGKAPSIAAVVPGLLGVSATLLYFFATHHTPLAVAAVVTSLYPAVTVGLAAVVLGERTTGAQRLGLLLCGLAVASLASA